MSEGFEFYIAGTGLVGLGLPFSDNISMIVCAEWFNGESVSGLIGIILSFS